MMTIKEQFISEIKERIALQKDLLKRAGDSARIEGSIDALQGLLNSMDVFSEEPASDDLEEAAENIYKVPFGTRAEDFKAGAKWQAEKCDEETSKLLYAERQTAYINGWHDCKEQMLKEAVEGVVMDFSSNQPRPQVDVLLDPHKYHTGDKVKIIIVKEDGK